MLSFHMFTLPILITSVQSYCQISRNFHKKFMAKKCQLQETTYGLGVGNARNISTRCQYNYSRDEFYQEIMWKPPIPTRTSVSGYRIKIMYRMTKYVCFHVPPSEQNFIFNRSLGLLHGCDFDLYVTPLPIHRIGNHFRAESVQVFGCPMSIKLLPLPNVVVNPGSNYSFVAVFEYEPTPDPLIKWYYSPDLINCNNRTAIDENLYKITSSKHSSVLMISGVDERHVGCYIAIADNGIEPRDEQRGYLQLNLTISLKVKFRKKTRGIEGPFFAALAGVMIVMIIALMITFIHKRRKESEGDVTREKMATKKVYISHCMEDKKEAVLLAQFAGALESFGIDAIVDIFSHVDIRYSGGLSRWIPRSIERADKIIILLTQKYVKALQLSSGDKSDDVTTEEYVRKIHSEVNYLNSLLIRDLCYPNNDVVIVAKNIQDTELPGSLDSKQWYRFPKKFDVKKDVCFRSIVEAISN